MGGRERETVRERERERERENSSRQEAYRSLPTNNLPKPSYVVSGDTR
jgi:hypothetical protein